MENPILKLIKKEEPTWHYVFEEGQPRLVASVGPVALCLGKGAE